MVNKAILRSPSSGLKTNDKMHAVQTYRWCDTVMHHSVEFVSCDRNRASPIIRSQTSFNTDRMHVRVRFPCDARITLGTVMPKRVPIAQLNIWPIESKSERTGLLRTIWRFKIKDPSFHDKWIAVYGFIKFQDDWIKFLDCISYDYIDLCTVDRSIYSNIVHFL